MKTSIPDGRKVAMTLPKFFVVLAVITVLAVLILPSMIHPPKYPEFHRINYQKQTGQWFSISAGTNRDKYLTAAPRTIGGPTNYITGSNDFRRLQATNGIDTPKTFLAPQEINEDHDPIAKIFRNWNSGFLAAWIQQQ